MSQEVAGVDTRQLGRQHTNANPTIEGIVSAKRVKRVGRPETFLELHVLNVLNPNLVAGDVVTVQVKGFTRVLLWQLYLQVPTTYPPSCPPPLTAMAAYPSPLA